MHPHPPENKLEQQLADLIAEKKAPLLGDVRDESAEDIRFVIKPKSRNVDPVVLMESLFKLSELPEMTRGRGVILQKSKGGELDTVRTFDIAQGWPVGFKDSDTKENAPKNWLGARGQTGLLPPKGFRFT